MGEKLTRLKAILDDLQKWEHKINCALAHGRNTHTFDDIVGLVLQNKAFFFSYEDCFIIMEKVDYPQFSVFHCFLAGGVMEAIINAQAEMAKIGEELGCKYLSIAGRKGWERQLHSLGWQHVCTTLYTPIGDDE